MYSGPSTEERITLSFVFHFVEVHITASPIGMRIMEARQTIVMIDFVLSEIVTFAVDEFVELSFFLFLLLFMGYLQFIIDLMCISVQVCVKGF